MNPLLNQLQPYPFARLKNLLSGITPNQALAPARLSIGEPEHKPPGFVAEILNENSDTLRRYPPTAGSPELKQAIANWANRRFNLASSELDPASMVLPCNGTREAIFSAVQAIVNPYSNEKPLVLMPNPFYQIYEGAAILAGAEAGFINNLPDTEIPDFDSVPEDQWQRCQLLFICTPGNPSGKAMSLEQMKHLLELAEEHDFVITSDECYSELYLDESSPVPGLLEAAAQSGIKDFKRCLVFHSLSKRSNLAGLRSGFIAGDPEIIAPFLTYRTYHGSAMPLQNQMASIAAWSDEKHVIENRALYREKYKELTPLLNEAFKLSMPDAGFYLWLETPVNDTEFVANLYRDQHLTVLPGSYLARESNGLNPGANRIRLALVSPLEVCREAVERLISQANRST